MTRKPLSYGEIREILISHAESQHTDHPQYAGHWDDWGLAIARKDIKGRDGKVSLAKNELCLISPKPAHKEEYSRYPNVLWTTVYLEKNLNGIDTSENSAHFRIIDPSFYQVEILSGQFLNCKAPVKH
jgi:hypothetical protein